MKSSDCYLLNLLQYFYAQHKQMQASAYMLIKVTNKMRMPHTDCPACSWTWSLCPCVLEERCLAVAKLCDCLFWHLSKVGLNLSLNQSTEHLWTGVCLRIKLSITRCCFSFHQDVFLTAGHCWKGGPACLNCQDVWWRLAPGWGDS